MAIEGPERLVIPGMRTISAKEALDRIDRFIRQVPGLTAVIIMGREGDTQHLACKHTTNITRDQLKAMIRRSGEILDEGGRVVAPA